MSIGIEMGPPIGIAENSLWPGLCHLEYGVPNTPATVFLLASVSKQFTAFAIYLLAKDGANAPGRRCLEARPELHDFGKVIAIRRLLHYMSGMREQRNLWPSPDGALTTRKSSEDDLASLLFRQTELNYARGSISLSYRRR